MLAMEYGPAFDPEEVGLCPVEGGRIWYRLNGKRHFSAGVVPLICIHGGPGLSHHYLLTLAALADARPVILYDQLDSGNSDKPADPENWRIERFLAEIDALRDHLNLSTVDIYGSSWGGTIAAEYAITRPKGLRSVILASPVIDVARWIDDCTEYRRALAKEIQSVLDEHEANGTTESDEYQDAVLHFYRRHLCRSDPWPFEINRSFDLFNYQMYQTMWGPAEFTCNGFLCGYSCADRLKEIDVPTLFTCGEHDEASPAACRIFADATPNAKCEVSIGCSHTAHLEKPSEYLATIRSFLGSLS